MSALLSPPRPNHLESPAPAAHSTVSHVDLDDCATDTYSWDELVRTHGPRVYRLALRLTGNPADADDLTQDTFIRVFRSIDSTRPESLEGWMHRITTNLFLDSMRRRKRIRFDGLGEGAEDRYPTAELGPEQVYDANHFDNDVSAALASLAPQFRVAVVLYDIEGYSYEEIAEMLDIKLGTVRSRIHRGRAALREALAHRAAGRTGHAAPASRRRSLPGLPGLPGLPSIPALTSNVSMA